jgi:hypothetical protein
VTEKHEEVEFAAVLTDSEWAEICEQGRFRCRYCGDYPPVGDISEFLENGSCAHCASVERKFAAD